MNAESFIEPGSGLRMYCGRWYILAEDGHFYTAIGFPTAEGAELYARVILPKSHDIKPEDIGTPKYSQLEAWDDIGICNILKADDLLHFWRQTDLAYLLEHQEP